MAGQKLTQSEIGDQWLKVHSDDTSYARNKWYRYANGVWGEIHRVIVHRELWVLLKMALMTNNAYPSVSMRDGIVGYLKDQIFMADDLLDQHPAYINLKNGVYDLSKHLLIEHNPSYYLTTQLPFAYNSGAACPTWERWIETTLVEKQNVHEQDKDLARFVQEAVGYSLTASTKHQVSFWCVGRGANGKSVLFHVLETLGGTAAMPFDANSLTRNRYQLADLAGKRIALCPEANSWGNIVADADLKELISGGALLVRQIREQSFTLHPIAKFWWAMNRVPTIADTSYGFWRRVKFVPFNRTFAPNERILDLHGRLDQELPGIFNWAMRGARRLIKNGSFSASAQVDLATESYRQEANLVESFTKEECTAGPILSCSSSTLYGAYRSWAILGGYKPVNSKLFKREMEDLDYKHTHTSAGNVYEGITVK